MPIDVLISWYQNELAGLQSGLLQSLPFVRGFGEVILVGVCLVIVVRITGFIVHLREPSSLLLLTPPRETNTSFTTTNELFKLLAGLMRYRPIIGRFFVPASRFSFEIVSTKSAGIQYVLRVPKRQTDAVTKTLHGYLPGMQVREIDEYLLGHSIPAKIIPFRLKTHFALPLKEHIELATHDPIAYLTNSMTQLGEHELIALQVVVRPLSRLHDAMLMRTIRGFRGQAIRGERVMLGSSAIGSVALTLMRAIGWLTTELTGAITTVARDASRNYGTTQAVAVPAALAPVPVVDLEQNAEIRAKLEQPLFLASVRACIQVDRGSRYSREQGIGGSFESFTSANGQGLRPAFDLLKSWRFRTRQLGGGVDVLAPSELAGLFHFPQTKTSETEDLVRSRSQELAAPLSFKHATPNFDTVFASNTFGGVVTPIGLTLDERRRHTYVLGATGSGKTTLLATMIYQDIMNGKGVAVVDPHGQLVEQILRTIPEERRQDVVWFAPDDDGFPIALNLLDLPDGEGLTPSQLQKQKSLVVSSINSIFQKFYDPKFFGPRMEYILRNTILTALETPQPTLLTILDLLTKTAYRKSVTGMLTNQVLKDYWANEFEKFGQLQKNTMISPITNKVGGILSSPLNYNILTQTRSKLDFAAVMNEGKILLCDLSKGKIGEDESSFFGSLVVAKLQLAALSRARIPEAERRDFYLYVDEFQNFATSTFGELVSEARKYRLSTILAHQSISQIEDRDIIKTLFANVGSVICFRTANPEDEQYILPIFQPEVSKHDIANLPLYRFYMKVSVGKPEAAFMADVQNFTVAGSDAIAANVIAESRAQYATPMEEIDSRVQPTPSLLDPRAENPGQSGSVDQDLFPLSLTGTEYGGDWQTVKSSSTTHTSLQLSLTNQQHEILLHLYRFRFLDRSHLQRFLNLTDYKNLNKLLQQLTDHQYIAKITRTKQPTIYYLNMNGITELKTLSTIDKDSLRKFAREHDRSDAFMQHSLTIASINLDLRNKDTRSMKYGMYVPSDYPALALSDQLTALSPHAVIVRQKAKETDLSFVEIVSELPDKHLKAQLLRYIRPFDTGEWRSDTHIPFPALLLVATTPEVAKTAQRLIKLFTRKLEGPKPKIFITTTDKVAKHGIAGDIWTTLS